METDALSEERKISVPPDRISLQNEQLASRTMRENIHSTDGILIWKNHLKASKTLNCLKNIRYDSQSASVTKIILCTVAYPISSKSR